MADFPTEGGPLLPPPTPSSPDALRERRDSAASPPKASPGSPPPPPAPAQPGGGTLREGAFAATPPPPSPSFSDREQPQQSRQRRRRDDKNSARWKPMRPGAGEAASARPQHPQPAPSYAGEASAVAVAVLATPEQVGLPPPTTLVTPPPAQPPTAGGLGIHQLQTPPGAAGDLVVLHQHHLHHNPGHAAAPADQPRQHQPLPVFYHGTPEGQPQQHQQQHHHHVQLLPQPQPQPQQPELFVGHYRQQPCHGPSFLVPPPEHHQHQPHHYQHQQLAVPAPHYHQYHQYHHVGPASNAPAVVQYPPPPFAAMTPLLPASHGSTHHPHQFLVAHRHHVVGHPAPPVPMSAAAAADGRNHQPRAERLAAALASMPPPAPGDAEPGARQLIVNYISAQVDEAALRRVFGAVGPVERIHIERHAPGGGGGGGGSSRQQPSRSRQFAFVYYARHQDALNAIVDVSGTVMNGRAIKVDWSTQRGPARPGTAGYRPPAVPGGYSGGPSAATSAAPTMPPPPRGPW